MPRPVFGYMEGRVLRQGCRRKGFESIFEVRLGATREGGTTSFYRGSAT